MPKTLVTPPRWLSMSSKNLHIKSHACMEQLIPQGPRPLVPPAQITKIAQKWPIPLFFRIFLAMTRHDINVFNFRFLILIPQALKKHKKNCIYWVPRGKGPQKGPPYGPQIFWRVPRKLCEVSFERYWWEKYVAKRIIKIGQVVSKIWPPRVLKMPWISFAYIHKGIPEKWLLVFWLDTNQFKFYSIMESTQFWTFWPG